MASVTTPSEQVQVNAPKRKTYVVPKLHTYGNLREMTQTAGNNTGGTLDIPASAYTS